MGGEKGSSRRKSGSSRGSPPRGRGKALDDDTRSRTRGITPAWAGKSRATAHRGSSRVDHPRVGGEKFDNPKIDNSQLGSPPRGRGKGMDCTLSQTNRRITPAWAGKRSWKHDHVRKHGDHPRVGGEKSFIYQFPFFRRGSPPRGRGKGLPPWLVICSLGITPAWAGKRLFCCSWPCS